MARYNIDSVRMIIERARCVGNWNDERTPNLSTLWYQRDLHLAKGGTNCVASSWRSVCGIWAIRVHAWVIVARKYQHPRVAMDELVDVAVYRRYRCNCRSKLYAGRCNHRFVSPNGTQYNFEASGAPQSIRWYYSRYFQFGRKKKKRDSRREATIKSNVTVIDSTITFVELRGDEWQGVC